jgi:hypothetical protein
MQEKMKNYVLVTCLFVFLFMVIGGGFHLTPGAALIAAASGTPLVIHAFKHRCNTQTRVAAARREEPASGVVPRETS